MRKGMFFNKVGGSSLPLANIISAWQMEDNANDSVSTNNGVATNTTYITGKVDKCADFSSATTSGIEVAHSTDFDFGNGSTDVPFSVSCYVYFDALGTPFFVSSYPNNTTRGWRFWASSSSKLNFQLFDTATGGNIYAQVVITWATSTWYHIVGTYDGSKSQFGLNLFANGSLLSASKIKVGTYGAMQSNTNPINIGRYKGATSLSLNGKMDEVFIWDKELSAAEVLGLYTEQNNGINILA